MRGRLEQLQRENLEYATRLSEFSNVRLRNESLIEEVQTLKTKLASMQGQLIGIGSRLGGSGKQDNVEDEAERKVALKSFSNLVSNVSCLDGKAALFLSEAIEERFGGGFRVKLAAGETTGLLVDTLELLNDFVLYHASTQRAETESDHRNRRLSTSPNLAKKKTTKERSISSERVRLSTNPDTRRELQKKGHRVEKKSKKEETRQKPSTKQLRVETSIPAESVHRRSSSTNRFNYINSINDTGTRSTKGALSNAANRFNVPPKSNTKKASETTKARKSPTPFDKWR
eukprot:TRINITY_DN2462_c0_g1_i4.p1 TRINITY_DN2462_c0_g1~~TRINITY_DN2462_c0_g1_i4.p1  ORF type:complete len:287 (-),score=43.71 TRINITY_DN2462_c0_g1_i4:98-958(-)